jgi:hypothetical protein
VSDWLDEAILSAAQARWRKVARIIGQVWVRFEGEADAKPERVAARIRALVAAGRLEGAGDLARWRHGEVRSPPGRSA